DFKNAFQIAEKYHAEALCAEAISYDFTKSENWRRGWDSNPWYLAIRQFSKLEHSTNYATPPVAESTGVEPVRAYAHEFSRLTHYRPAHSPSHIFYH
ncbi:MAG: hypothetical protein UW68_C0038G0009, partial [Candidatus Collierbacteria bacterium GW2011_GWB1_44_6]